MSEEEKHNKIYAGGTTLGGFLHIVVFFIYFWIYVNIKPLLVISMIFAWLIWLYRRITLRIKIGMINPELPEGRFKRIKRLNYGFAQKIPFIRPPKSTVRALHGVNLEIGTGMFGLLGPNGPGKTTLMRILVGVLQQDRGSIKINGLDLDEHRDTFHGSIGYLPQDFGLYENMTPVEYLNYQAITNGIYEQKDRDDRVNNILKSVGLWERRKDKVKTFSGGMKQRVGIAQTLLYLPQIIVVDEPTAGLDPRERIRFRNLLSELAKERIIVFSTHIIEDISTTCKDLAVMDEGRVIFRGSPEELQQRAHELVYEATISEELFDAMKKRNQYHST